jgi:hypothetical protein
MSRLEAAWSQSQNARSSAAGPLAATTACDAVGFDRVDDVVGLVVAALHSDATRQQAALAMTIDRFSMSILRLHVDTSKRTSGGRARL